MNLKIPFFYLTAVLAMVCCAQQQVSAESKCGLLRKIDATTQQDLLVDQNTLNLVQQDLALDHQILDVANQIQDCACTCQLIFPSDFNDGTGTLSKTYTINKSGKYCLDADVNFQSIAANSIAIQILANDVTLDLSEYHLNQTATSIAGTIGIYVGPSLTNVTILNGQISGFSNRGIWYDQATSIITLDDLFVENCGTGIHLGPNVAATNPSQINTYVSQVVLKNSRLLRNGAGGGLNIRANQNILVENCQVNESTPTSAGTLIQGIATPLTEQLGYAQNVRVANCTFNQTVGGAASCALQVIDNLHVTGCQFNNNQLSSAVVSAGCVRAATVNCLFEDCEANNNSFILGQMRTVTVASGGSGYAVNDILAVSGGNGLGRLTVTAVSGGAVTAVAVQTAGAGYAVGTNIATTAVAPSSGTGATINITVLQAPSIFNGYHDSGNSATGLNRTDTPTFRNCEANENVAPGSVAGFEISYKSNMLFENCRASKNRSLTQAVTNTGTIISTPSAIGFQITASNGAVQSPISDLHSGGNNCVFVNCIATENVAEQGLGAGFAFLGGHFFTNNMIKQDVSFVNCEALGNVGLADSPAIVRPGVYNFPPALGIGAGIIVDRGVIPNFDNNNLNVPGRFPAAAYKNIAVTNSVLSGNTCGPTPTATGQQYSGGVVLIGVDTASVSNNDVSMGNTNGFILTGGTTWAGQTIATTSNALIQNCQAINNTQAGGGYIGYGFSDAVGGVPNATPNLNAFVGNTGFKNPTANFNIGASYSVNNVSIP